MSRLRVAILCGPALRHLSTCATLIEAGVDVAGICICDQRTVGLPLRHVWRGIRRKGLGKVLGQVLGRLYYGLRNRREDLEIERALYDEEAIRARLESWDGDVHRTRSYSDPQTLRWLESREADALVVHSPYWVGRKVRALPRKGIVLGSHPGIVPRYRGSHSAFWAIYSGCPEDVGSSVFWLDEGADTGDLIAQERIDPQPGDSYVSLGWKGMIRAAEITAAVILAHERGEEIPRQPHDHIPEGSYYDVPTLGEYLEYRRRQSSTR